MRDNGERERTSGKEMASEEKETDRERAIDKWRRREREQDGEHPSKCDEKKERDPQTCERE